MFKNITVTLAQRYGYLNILWGFNFILSAWLPLTGSSLLKSIASIIALITILLIALTLIFLKTELEDERAIDNIHRAYTMAFSLAMVFGTLFSFLDLRCNFNFAAKPAVDSFMGLVLIFSGAFFLYYERKGY